MTMDDLWAAAESAAIDFGGKDEIRSHLWGLAKGGHQNAKAIMQAALDDATGCSCGDVEICGGSETPERVKLREALAALVARM